MNDALAAVFKAVLHKALLDRDGGAVFKGDRHIAFLALGVGDLAFLGELGGSGLLGRGRLFSRSGFLDRGSFLDRGRFLDRGGFLDRSGFLDRGGFLDRSGFLGRGGFLFGSNVNAINIDLVDAVCVGRAAVVSGAGAAVHVGAVDNVAQEAVDSCVGAVVKDKVFGEGRVMVGLAGYRADRGADFGVAALDIDAGDLVNASGVAAGPVDLGGSADVELAVGPGHRRW